MQLSHFQTYLNLMHFPLSTAIKNQRLPACGTQVRDKLHLPSNSRCPRGQLSFPLHWFPVVSEVPLEEDYFCLSTAIPYLFSQSSCLLLVSQSCPTLCSPMDCSPLDSFFHGILQARIWEWVAIFSASWEYFNLTS